MNYSNFKTRKPLTPNQLEYNRNLNLSRLWEIVHHYLGNRPEVFKA